MQEFIAYRRTSASEKGRPALGLDAQAAAIMEFVRSRHGVLLEDFVEIEAGKGSDALERRPRLLEALALARKRRAVLVVAKLDRLSRDPHFISGLMASGVDFISAEAPTAHASMLHIYAAVARHERDQASGRISAALQAKKRAALAAGQANPLGNTASLQANNRRRQAAADAFAKGLAKTLKAYRKSGMSQRQMVEALNDQGITTARGGRWSLQQLQRVLARL